MALSARARLQRYDMSTSTDIVMRGGRPLFFAHARVREAALVLTAPKYLQAHTRPHTRVGKMSRQNSLGRGGVELDTRSAATNL